MSVKLHFGRCQDDDRKGVVEVTEGGKEANIIAHNNMRDIWGGVAELLRGDDVHQHHINQTLR